MAVHLQVHSALHTQTLQPTSNHQYLWRLYYTRYSLDRERTSGERHLTSLKTGLLLLMSLTPTITSAKLLRGVGPPEALSSIAVTFRVYCGPFRLGGGFLRSLMIPGFGSIKCHVNLLCKHTKSSKHHISLSLYCWFSLCFGCKAQGPVILVCTDLEQDPKFWLTVEEQP